MRSVSKSWSSRLISTVAALALIVASTIGAVAHAAGHTHHHDHLADSHAHGAEIPVVAAIVEAGDTDSQHERGDTGHSHAHCNDTICHGGQAILTALPVLPLPALGAAFVWRSGALDSRPPSCLERPPRPFVLA